MFVALRSGLLRLRANTFSPICSQCQDFSLLCRYQEGGKRGLPAAYITSLERRLQETEIALSATLFSLQEVKGFEFLERNMISARSVPGRARSKAEKQNEWKRLPLQNSEHLAAWLRDKHNHDEMPGAEQSIFHLPRPFAGIQDFMLKNDQTHSQNNTTTPGYLMDHEDDRFSQSDSRVEGELSSKRRRTSAPPAREVGLMRSIPGDKFTGFVGSASGIFFIRSVYGAIRPSHPSVSDQAETPGSEIVPGEDDHLPSILPNSSEQLWDDTEVNSGPASSVSFQDFVSWSGSFFANWHAAYPFVHAPAVLNYFDELSQRARPWVNSVEDFQMILLRSIMSISLADRRQSSISDEILYPIDLVFPSYDAAVDSLRPVLSRPTSIPGLQAAISVQLFLVSMLRLNAASRLGGLIIRMALQLGLHRCPSRFQSFSSSTRELRQRIFWSVYAIDRFICQSMGLPLGLHDDDVDVCFPSTERHLDNQVYRPDSKLRLLNLLARHAEMRGEIIELRNKSLYYVQKDPDRATAITAKLAQWWNDVEEINDNDDEQRPSAYHLTILALLRHESTISLNRPTLATSPQGATYDAALQLCIGSARSIITLLHKALDKRDNQGRDLQPLTLLWPSCTWAVWISTFILFYAAHAKHISQNTVMRLADRSLEILQHLSRRGSAWPEASAAAIRDLRARMINRDAAAQTQHQSGINPTFTDGDDLPLSHDFPKPSPHNASFPIEAPIARPVTGRIEENMSPIIGPTSAPGFDLTFDNRAQNDLHRDPILFDLGDYDWNKAMDASASVGQNNIDNSIDPFSGFDIPFWFEQGQHWDMPQ
ncbi:Nn.00g046340.m01.CDS01 [Neocucurbitaria sp. VM-36]